MPEKLELEIPNRGHLGNGALLATFQALLGFANLVLPFRPGRRARPVTGAILSPANGGADHDHGDRYRQFADKCLKAIWVARAPEVRALLVQFA